MENKEIINNRLIKIAYLLTSIIFAIPSVMYLLKNKTVYYFIYVFKFIYRDSKNANENLINTFLYVSLFFILFSLYFYILKNCNKIFKNQKSMFTFIIIVGLLFCIIIPTTSLDVYSYIGNGWVDSKYNENPYYTSVQDVTDQYGKDEMLGKVARCWRDEPVVYGPAWSLICKILTSVSFGNITVALYIFKLGALLAFLGGTYLIYKITGKKFYMLMFALNPYILFEFLSNVHNDIFLVLFVLLAIYFVKNKRNIVLAVASIAIATAIKYLSILILPFIIIYGLKNENMKNKIIKTILYAFEFIIIIFAFYALYIRNLQVLSGIFIQQNKYGRSIFLVIYNLANGNEKILNYIKISILFIFTITYVTVVLKIFFRKNIESIKLRKLLKAYQIFIIIFTFVLITNFNPWYVIWLFPTLMWQKANNIKLTLYLSAGAIASYAITYATKIDDETVGIPYLVTMLLTTGLLYSINCLLKKIKTTKLN